jgi:hypothetical protein
MIAIAKDSEFDSFAELDAAVTLYCENKHVLFVKNDCKTVASANKPLAPDVPRFHERFVYRFIRYRCKHGGELRTKGCGIRPNQRY